MTECEIRKITAPLLIKQLFAIHAPALELEGEWPRLFEMNDAERAHELAERIKDLAKVSLKQRDLIYSHLGTIDVVSSQARQTEAIEKMIEGEKPLHEQYCFPDFGKIKGRKERSRLPHNIATWINIVAHTKEGGAQYSKTVIAGAKRIWDRLAAQAVVISNQEGSCTFYLTSPTKNQTATLEARAKLFEDAYKKYRSKLTGLENYPAKVDPTVRSSFIRFSVNMAADPHMSIQVGEDGTFNPLIDPNADKFKIDYFPGRDYIRMSRVVDRETSLAIAKLFAETIGSEVQDFKKKRYSLAQFDSCKPETLALPPENTKRGDRIWLSAIDSAYLDRNGNVVSKNREYDFPYDSERDIYENLRQSKEMGKPRSRVENLVDRRETIGLDITFELHDYEDGGEGRRLFRDDFMKPITIKVRPTQNDYLSKVRDLKPYHRKLIVDVLEKCDLMPKNRDEMNKGLV